MAPGAPGGTRYYRKPPITSLTSQLIPSVRPGQARNQYTSGSMRLYLRLGKKGRRTAWSQVSCEQAHLCKFGENYLAAEPSREEKWVEWRVRHPRGGGRGYFLARPSQEANGDVPLDGVAFSRLKWLEWGCTFSDFLGGYYSSSYLRLANVPECLYHRWKVKCFSFDLKNGSIHKNRKRQLRSRKLHICTKVTKMGSMIGHRIEMG